MDDIPFVIKIPQDYQVNNHSKLVLENIIQ